MHGENVSGVLLGSAAILAAPHAWSTAPFSHGDVLVLTQLEVGQTGSLVLTVLDDLRPIHEFRASFQLFIRGDECGKVGVLGHCGAEGVSFVFGPLPGTPPLPSHPFGELGVGRGLRVSFLTGLEHRVEVRYNNTLLASVPGELHVEGGWTDVEVKYSSDGLHWSWTCHL